MQQETLSELNSSYNVYKDKYLVYNTQLNMYLEQKDKLTEAIEEQEKLVFLYDETAKFLTVVSDHARTSIKTHFETFVTYVLQYVFGPDYSFTIEWEDNLKTSSVSFLINTPYKGDTLGVECDYAKGGGVEDVVAFALRLAFLILLKNEGPIFLDEAFSQSSKSLIPNIANMFREVNEKFGYQIIFITHARDSAFTETADVVYSVDLIDEASQVVACG